MFNRLIIAAATALAASNAPAAEFDGTTLTQLAAENEVAAVAYVMGFHAGFSAHGFVQEGVLKSRGIPVENFRKVMDEPRVRFCPPDSMTNGQGLEVVLGYIKANPGEASKAADVLVWKSFVAAFPCKGAEKPTKQRGNV